MITFSSLFFCSAHSVVFRVKSLNSPCWAAEGRQTFPSGVSRPPKSLWILPYLYWFVTDSGCNLASISDYNSSAEICQNHVFLSPLGPSRPANKLSMLVLVAASWLGDTRLVGFILWWPCCVTDLSSGSFTMRGTRLVERSLWPALSRWHVTVFRRFPRPPANQLLFIPELLQSRLFSSSSHCFCADPPVSWRSLPFSTFSGPNWWSDCGDGFDWLLLICWWVLLVKNLPIKRRYFVQPSSHILSDLLV